MAFKFFKRLDLVVYGATPRCDSRLTPRATGHPQPGAADTNGAVLRVAERRKRSTYPELCSGGPQELVVLGSEVGGRWNGEAGRFVQHLLHSLCFASKRAKKTFLFNLLLLKAIGVAFTCWAPAG